MNNFDLAISYVWEYDEEFVKAIEDFFQSNGLTTFVITESNIGKITSEVKEKKLNFLFYLDRASDVDDDFAELAQTLSRKRCNIINPYKRVEHAIDKATMHLEFLTAGLVVPYSIILPPHDQIKEVSISVGDLSLLGRPFIIKPCNTTGGGIGVVTGAETLKDVLAERNRHSKDKYILQEKIYPKMIDGKRAWFRCFWAFGKPICTWWNDETHIYDIISDDELQNFKLKKLFQLTRAIAKLTKLDFFSTEIAITNKDKYVVIDYVNDQCDMRLKSNHPDGVPDEIVYQIIELMKQSIQKNKNKR